MLFLAQPEKREEREVKDFIFVTFLHVVSTMVRIEALKFIGLKLRGVKASRQTGAVQTMEVRQHN